MLKVVIGMIILDMKEEFLITMRKKNMKDQQKKKDMDINNLKKKEIMDTKNLKKKEDMDMGKKVYKGIIKIFLI